MPCLRENYNYKVLFSFQTVVVPADDGIGPHARHRRFLPNRDSEFFDNDGAGVPYFGEDNASQIGNNVARSYQREYAQIGGRSYPMPTGDGAPLSWVPQQPASGYPQGAYPQMGSNEPMGFLRQGAMPQGPVKNAPMGAPQHSYPALDVEYMESPYTGVTGPYEETVQRPGRLPVNISDYLNELEWCRV